MTILEELESKIRNAIPELKEEFEAFEDSSLDRDMITPMMLNHVMKYMKSKDYALDFTRKYSKQTWNLDYVCLKHQSTELITFLNELK